MRLAAPGHSRRLSAIHALSMLAVAFSAAILWFQLIPSWLAFASLGVTLATAGMTSNARYNRVSLKRRSARTGKKRHDTTPTNRWTAFARASEPFTNWRIRRRPAQTFEGIHQKRLRAEALFYDLVKTTPAAEMLTSPVLRRQRDLIAALSIEEFVAKAALEAHARVPSERTQ
jgi:hypothetical protein